jgi:hypothetical protein
MSKIQIEEIAEQTLLMSIDGEPKCEFVFDGDEVSITNANGEPITNELIAERYLRLLFEEANINIEVKDSDEDKVEFVID